MERLKLYNINALEWTEIKSFLSSLAVFEKTKQKLAELSPETVNYKKEFTYLQDFKDVDPDEISVRGIENVEEEVRRAEKGGTLSGPELLSIASFIRAFISIKESLRARKDSMKTLYSLVLEIDVPLHIMREIYRMVDDNGNLYDTAHEELPHLRNKIIHLREKVEEVFRKLKEEKKRIFQDDYITIRNRRFVFPIKVEEKGWIEGIIHGKSSTEETYFIEPVELIHINNEIRVCEDRIEEIENKIFAELSALVGEEGENLKRMVDFIYLLDETLAKAKFMKVISGCIPRFTEKREIKLYGLKHPLLLKEEKEVVSNNVEIDENTKAVVISGPNAGGKTVLMKSIGLTVLLAYSGLPVPCEKAEIGKFNGICAEIGDPQNIAFGLSTFSGHILNLKRIYELSDSNVLILLDEAFSGTNPSEGDALLIAYAEEMMNRGNLVLLTTHSPEVMAWAEGKEDAFNFGMGYDPNTLTPTYRGEKGRIGISASFEIAQKMGFPREIIERAKKRRKEESHLSELYLRLSEKEREIERLLSEAKEKERKAEETLYHIEEKEREIEKKRKDALKKINEEVRATRRKLKTLFEKAKKMQKPEEVEKITHEVEEIERKLEEIFIPLETLPEEGDVVFIPSLNRKGTVSSVDRKRKIVEVEVKGKKMKVPLGMLAKEK